MDSPYDLFSAFLRFLDSVSDANDTDGLIFVCSFFAVLSAGMFLLGARR